GWRRRRRTGAGPRPAPARPGPRGARSGRPPPPGRAGAGVPSGRTPAPGTSRARLRSCGLADALDPDEVAGHADALRDRHAEEEGRPPARGGLGRDQVGAHVLDDVDPAVGQQHLVDDERFLRVLTRDDLDRPGVAADRDDVLRDEPLGRVLAGAGLARVVERVLRRELLEEVAPAGVDDDDVTLAQRRVVHLEPGLQVGRGDQGTLVEARLLARRVRLQLAGLLVHLHHVDHHAPGAKGLEGLEPGLALVV